MLDLSFPAANGDEVYREQKEGPLRRAVRKTEENPRGR